MAVEGEVFDVPNGNGMKVRVNGKVLEIRLFGIDAPAPQQDCAEAAQQFLEQLIVDGKVRLDLLGPGRHGETVAFAASGGKSLNKELVRAGYAWKNPRICRKEPFCSELNELERQAKAERRGLWQADNPVPPWAWRRQSEQRRRP